MIQPELSTYDPQEAFDTIVQHLAKQGRPARVGKYGQCLYLADDGRQCAVGCLITNYDDSMEGYIVSDFDFADGDLVDLLQEMQLIHDASWAWSEGGFIGWGRLASIAEHFNLDTTVLDQSRTRKDISS